MGGVYLIRAQNGLVKIGKSSNVDGRFRSLQSMSPVPIALIGYLKSDGRGSLERALHKAFQSKHIHGEWYALDADDVEKCYEIAKSHQVSFHAEIEKERTNEALKIRRQAEESRAMVRRINEVKSRLMKENVGI